MENTLFTLIGGCFVLIGASTGAYFCYRILQGIASTRWPFVVGDLESAELKEAVFRGIGSSGGFDGASAWVVNFGYRYTIAGREYRGSRVTCSDGINKTMRALRRLRDRYRGKSQIQVFYNPTNPAQSVLVPGANLYNFTPLITSTLFVIVGIFILAHDFSQG